MQLHIEVRNDTEYGRKGKSFYQSGNAKMTYSFYSLPVLPSFQPGDIGELFTQPDICVTFYEDLGGHLYYIHYVDGKASEIVGFEQEADNSYTAFCLAYDELSDNYWTLENLKDTIQEGTEQLSKLGTIAEEDFRPLANMFVPERALPYQQFAEWLDATLSHNIPKGVVAFNFNIYEDADFQWSVELVGTSKSDDEDADWACYDELFNNREQPFVWHEVTGWPRIQKEVEDVILIYLAEGHYRNKLLAGRAVGAGFVEGDVYILYRCKEKPQTKKLFWRSKYFFLVLFLLVATALAFLLPVGDARDKVGLIVGVVISLWCGAMALEERETKRMRKEA